MRSNKCTSTSRQFFDVYVIVSNSNSFTNTIFTYVYSYLLQDKFLRTALMCTPNSKSIVLRIFHVRVCVLSS